MIGDKLNAEIAGAAKIDEPDSWPAPCLSNPAVPSDSQRQGSEISYLEISCHVVECWTQRFRS